MLYWEEDPKYKAIITALETYWLNEKDEKHVKVTMEFEKSDGQCQIKCIEWENPYLGGGEDG